jgi:hypothetical protein
VLWGVYDLSVHEVVELFPSRDAAVRMLQEVLADEPDWREILSVICIRIGVEINLN